MAEAASGSAPATETAEEIAAKVASKRYESLMTVRNKAVKGKGAWYWAHLEPMLVHDPNTGLPKAVKLRCLLCDAVFSASNPSRTATEHLKRGTCPNFSVTADPTRIQDPNLDSNPISPSNATTVASSSSVQKNHRKRAARPISLVPGQGPAYSVAPIFDPDPTRVSDPNRALVPTRQDVGGLYSGHGQQHLVLSGGKEDLGALAMLEDSVKKLKSPKSSPGPVLSKVQIDSSLDYLAHWVYECCGSVAFSSLEHPKFRSFLNQVGLPGVNRRELVGERLDAKYESVKAESEARIRDAMFFQVSSDGWKSKFSGVLGEENVVHLSLNLPNGTAVYRRAVFTNGFVPSKYAEEVFLETIGEICGNNVHQCVSIVADKFKAKALRNLENQHQWMVNLSCQFRGFNSLIKDFSKELPLFSNVAQNCLKLANFVNHKSLVRNSFHKFQLQEYGRAGLLRVHFRSNERLDYEPLCNLVEDVLSSARALHLVFLDDSCKMISLEDPVGRELEEMLRNPQFWNELDAVHSLVKLIKGMAKEIEKERPRVGQCLPLWEDLRVKVRDWCGKFRISESHVEKVIDKRFRRNYHPAWAAAFILDPFYLIRDSTGKYLPPFKFLSPEQEKDVDKLITRLVSREEAHIALMELMKWRSEGLDPVYAQAVQLKQRDPTTGKMKIANPQSSRLVWETYLTEFKSLRKVAVRLIFLHATSCGIKCNWNFPRWAQSRAGMEKAQKLIFIAAHSKLGRRDFSNDDNKDEEFFTLANGEDDVLNEVFVDASSL